MNSLIALDLANLESFADSLCAFREITISLAPSCVISSSLSRATVERRNPFRRKTTCDAYKSMLFPISRQDSSSRQEVKDFLSRSIYRKSDGSMSLDTFLFFAGRAALRFVFESLAFEKGGEVIVQGFTCEAVILPILKSGLKPVYVDINPDDYSASLGDLKGKISDKTRVVILQHTFGITPRVRTAIIDLCVAHDAWLIEDLAHGFVPNTLEPPKNTQKYLALTSFGRSKLISSVFGAAITTPNSDLAKKLRDIEASLPQPPPSLVLRCLLYKLLMPTIKLTYPWGIGKVLHYVCNMLQLFPREISKTEKAGSYDTQYEYAYPEPLAHTLCLQITKLPQSLKMIEDAVGEYERGLGQSRLPSPALNRFPFLLPRYVEREDILQHFRGQNIYLGSWYTQAIGPSKIDLQAMAYTLGTCPVAESVCAKIINLPTNISQETAHYIATELKKLITRHEIPTGSLRDMKHKACNM